MRRSVERLVEQQDVGGLGERPGDEDALLLAAGELADLCVAELPHPDLPKHSATRPHGRRPAAEPPDMGVAAHQDDIPHGDRKVPVDHFALRDVGDARPHGDGGLAEQRDRPAHDRHEAEDGLEERALAPAIRPDDADDLTSADAVIHVAQHDLCGNATVRSG